MEILTFSCFVLFLVTAEPSLNAKLQQIKMASCKKHSGTKLDKFQSRVLEILSVSCYAIF